MSKYEKNAADIKKATALLIKGFEDPNVGLLEKMDCLRRVMEVTKALRTVYKEED